MSQYNPELFSNLLVNHILGGNAFIKIEEILDKIPFHQVGIKFYGLPYSFWQIFDHMRIAQRDILDFSMSSNSKKLKWPEEYWPGNPAPDSIDHWEQTKEDFFNDRESFNVLIKSNSDILLEPFSYGTGQNLFREALLILEHNAYHTGQLMLISRFIGD